MKTFVLLLAIFGVVASQRSSYRRQEDTYANCVRAPRPPRCPSDQDDQKCKHTISGCFRSADGTCNNKENPTLGAPNTRLARVVDAQYADGIDLPRGHHRSYDYRHYPTPHQVSKATFHSKQSSFSNTKKLSTMFMTFGQFLDHDMTFSPHETCNVTDCSKEMTKRYPCFPIKFDHDRDDCTGFARSKPACKYDNKEERNQVNELTSFVDLSMVYGSTDKKAKEVRKNDGSGQLKMDRNGILPVDPEETAKEECKNPAKCHLLGDKRGEENIALFAMHNLWVRQHNRVAKELKRINPHWDGEKVFQTARKINGGIFQHIVYTEYLPNIIFPFERRPSTYTKYNPKVDPSIINGFSSAAFRYGHSLIPNKFGQMNSNFENSHQDVPLQHSFENSTLILKHGIAPTLIGLCGNMSSEVDDTFAHDILNKLFVHPGSHLHNDLTALNIQRARDHGIPTFGKWKEFCKFPAARDFRDLLYTPRKTQKAFSKIYNDVNDIDLFAVGITERHLGTKIVGPTFHCIIQEQFRRLRDGDRFFYTHEGVFHKTQLDEIKKGSLARVLCNNLKNDGMVSIQRDAFKVFEPRNDRRVTCESIPDVDLEKWREYPSYGQRTQSLHPTRPQHNVRRQPYGSAYRRYVARRYAQRRAQRRAHYQAQRRAHPGYGY